MRLADIIFPARAALATRVTLFSLSRFGGRSCRLGAVRRLRLIGYGEERDAGAFEFLVLLPVSPLFL